jgi:hypothetical protein
VSRNPKHADLAGPNGAEWVRELSFRGRMGSFCKFLPGLPAKSGSGFLSTGAAETGFFRMSYVFVREIPGLGWLAEETAQPRRCCWAAGPPRLGVPSASTVLRVALASAAPRGRLSHLCGSSSTGMQPRSRASCCCRCGWRHHALPAGVTAAGYRQCLTRRPRYVEGMLEKREPFRARHLRHAAAAVESNQMILGTRSHAIKCVPPPPGSHAPPCCRRGAGRSGG